MNGPGHYREAERLLEQATDEANSADWGPMECSLRRAEIHATLALAAANAAALLPDLTEFGVLPPVEAWRETIA